MLTERTKETVDVSEKIISLLNNRKGFNHWWDSIYEEDKKEILQEIKYEIYGSLTKLSKPNIFLE
jgi:hypothetical protein